MRARGAIPTPRSVLADAVPFRSAPRLMGLPQTFGTVPSRLSYWLNQVDGCCCTSESAAAKAAFSVWGGVDAPASEELWIPDDSVKDWATRHKVLQGAVISDVLKWMETDGLKASDGKLYTEGVAHSVDWTNDATLRAAILQGPVKIGVAAAQLEDAVGDTNGWVGWNFTADDEYDHCVGLWGFGSLRALCGMLKVPVPNSILGSMPAYLLFTWKTVGIVTRQSLLNICCEAWVRVPTTVQQYYPVAA